MKEFWPILVSLLPLILGAVLLVLIVVILFIGNATAKLQGLVSIFLQGPVSLKTWGLFLAAGTTSLFMNAVLLKLGDKSMMTGNEAVDLARIQALRELGWLNAANFAIIVCSFGAVAFKGQLPGGSSVSINQKPDGEVVASASGPAAAPAAPVAPELPKTT